MPLLPLLRGRRPALASALALSLALHGAVLFLLASAPREEMHSRPRLQARLTLKAPPASPAAPAAPLAQALPTPFPAPRHGQAPLRKKLLAQAKAKAPAVVSPPPAPAAAAREEGDRVVRGLESPSREPGTLAQRALAMARDAGYRLAREDQDGAATLERVPDSPEVDPFSLEMYLDALVKKLNRSAAFVRNDPRSQGLKAAAVRIRLNPDGSLKSFDVVNAGDQQDQIAFIKAVVQQAIPFSPFPRDIRQSARSLAMHICILPAGGDGSGFGFTRTPGRRSC